MLNSVRNGNVLNESLPNSLVESVRKERTGVLSELGKKLVTSPIGIVRWYSKERTPLVTSRVPERRKSIVSREFPVDPPDLLRVISKVVLVFPH